MNVTAQDEIYAYVEGVRQALAGLSDAVREELLEDLPEHLAEVRAEGTGTLVERLGSPEAYAAELRATAGLVGDFPSPPPGRFAGLIEAREQAEQILARVDDRVGPVIGYEKASHFLVLLRPGWWVLRGYLVAMVIAYWADGNSRLGLLPRVGNNELAAVVLLIGCAILSIVLGRRTPSLSRMPRIALRAATVLLVIFALAGFESTDSNARQNAGYDTANYSYSDPNPYSNVNDVYVYDSQGRLVTNARLFDQDGNPIQLGTNICYNESSGEGIRSRNLGYPYCPQNAPFAASPSASASASTSASASASASASPSPSGLPPLPSPS